MPGLVSNTARHVRIDANSVVVVIALDYEDSLLAFQGCRYEPDDRMVKLFVPAPRLLHGDFK
jgi:hypothetical protein